MVKRVRIKKERVKADTKPGRIQRSATKDEYGLTDRRRAFCDEFIKTGNATQSYLKVFESKCKPHHLHMKANKLMKEPVVINYISKVRAEITKNNLDRYKVTRERIIEHLAYIAFSNSGDYFEWGPNGLVLKDSNDLTDEQKAAVQGISETLTQYGGTTRLTLGDKLEALSLLGKLDDIAMFTTKQHLTIESEFKDMTDEELAAFIDDQEGRQETH